ncbi:MAG: DNA polymerase I [Patescibacteria group bacterium]
MSKKKEKFVIIDGNALIHRAFHAMPPLATKDGTLVNAAYGFTTILMRVMKDLKPKYIVTAFDLAAPTFRHEAYEEYKATRVKQADELYEQFPIVKDILKAFTIPVFEQEGYEADDIIGTIAYELGEEKDIDCYIVTGDMDTLQLVDDSTFVFAPKRTISDVMIYDAAAVKEKYGGLGPDQLIDYKALRGDPSDNIPGVKGVGEKTAIALLQAHDTLDKLYSEYEDDPHIKPRIKNLLTEHKEDAFLSKKLATIERQVPVEWKLDEAIFSGVDREQMVSLFQELEFKSLLVKVPDLEAKLDVAKHVVKDNKEHNYMRIDNDKDLQKLLAELDKQRVVSFDTETTDLNPWQSELVGISLSWKQESAVFIHWPSVASSKQAKDLHAFFARTDVLKVAHNAKFDIEVLLHAGIKVAGPVYDTMLAAYVLHPGDRGLKLDTQVFSEFGHQMIPIEELIGKKGKNQLTMLDVPLEQLTEYACEDADYTLQLYEVLKRRIEKAGFESLLDDIEFPLVPVLVDMEHQGIKVDESFLQNFQKQLASDIENIEKQIYEMAGEEFNVASPKQLKVILFEKLEIPTDGLKKTKTGVSTAASELEKMKGLHPIIDLISDFRELAKLQSTYVEALPKLINKDTGRVHTSFNQTITATGRLSSSDPNLQNIPIRTKLGREIRKAFVAEKGNVLIAADYSQIELRVVAHLSDDQRMIETFKTQGDIHRTTASFIFDVPLDQVDRDMRRSAKEVNFGVLYGMGAYGLSQRTGISMAEAREFIDKYFAQYPKMKQYTESLIEHAEEEGYVETMFGRRRYLPDINSGVAMVRNAAKRAAINLPVQGTSADIMKLAMIRVYDEVVKGNEDVRMLLQVHDELVFEVPEDRAKEIGEKVQDVMEHIAKLKVPLEVDVKVGLNWDDME